MTGEETKSWEKKFNDKFVWQVTPVGIEKGDKDQERYVLGLPINDWADKTTLAEVKEFIQSEIITPYEKQLEQMERENKNGVLSRMWH